MSVRKSGNAKLIGGATFDLPPQLTCPGKTEVCEEYCYARHGRFKWENVTKKFWNNLLEYMETGELPDIKGKPSFIRLHVSGDFFSTDYVDAVERFAKRYPDIPMFGYTRSWRVDALKDAVVALNDVDNITMWASADKDTEIPDIGLKVAYMSVDDEKPPQKVDLIFRAFSTNPSVTAMKRKASKVRRLGGSKVCPDQTGYKKIGCALCGYCYGK
jgi:hypothetical protein